MKSDSSIILRDNRGNRQTYEVIRAADGNCWMTENLRLSSIDNASSLSLTNANTDLNNKSSWTLPAPSEYTNSPVHTPAYVVGKIGLKKYNGNAWQEGWGNYYNWPAAVAEDNTSSYTANGTQMTNSICPKGWKLPIGNQSSNASGTDLSFGKLSGAYGWTTGQDANNSVLNINSPGFWYGDDKDLFLGGASGAFWSRTVPNGNNGYSLFFTSSYFSPSDTGNSRFLGGSIRCVADG